MKRKAIFVIVMFVTLMLPASVILAGTFRSPSKDITCAVGGACDNNFGVQVGGSGGPGGGCSPTRVGYIGWDLSSESRSWTSAQMTLTAYYKDSNGPFTFELHPVNTETWTESTATDPGYDANTILATATDDLSDNQVVFASDELGSHFQQLKGGDATIAVVMTDGCGSVDALVAFEDREGTGGSAPQSANEANLVFWTGPVQGGSPTAVEVKSLQIENNALSTPNWPLIAGLFALVAVVVVGIGYGVRRSKQS